MVGRIHSLAVDAEVYFHTKQCRTGNPTACHCPRLQARKPLSSLLALYNPHTLNSFLFFRRKYKGVYTDLLKKGLFCTANRRLGCFLLFFNTN